MWKTRDVCVRKQWPPVVHLIRLEEFYNMNIETLEVLAVPTTNGAANQMYKIFFFCFISTNCKVATAKLWQDISTFVYHDYDKRVF